MAEGLKIKIGADIVEVTQSLNDVERDIKQLSKEIKNLSGQALVDANKQLEVLNQRAQGLKNIGRGGFDQFGAAIQGAGRSAAGAVPALNSLGQVARDLPFGFIAIQNNLPIVIDQFTALSRSSGGLGPALKGLAGALVGPAGIAFAFGALVAGATSLVQKYGSLDAAIAELGSSIDSTGAKQNKFNAGLNEALANIQVESDRINQLSKALTDSNASRNQQINAYETLKRIQPAIIGNLTLEEAITEKGREAILKRTQATLEYINIKGQEEALSKLVAEASAEEIKQGRLLVRSLTEQRNLFGKLTDFVTGLGNAQLGALRRVNKFASGAKYAADDVEFFSDALRKNREQQLQVDPSIANYDAFIAKLKAEQKALEDAQRKAVARQEEQQKEFAKSAAEAEKFRERVEAIRNELSQLRPIVIPIRTKAEITEINPRFLTTDIAGNVVELPVKVKPVLDLAGLSAAPGLDKFKLPTFSPDVTGFKLYQDQLIKLGQTSQQIGGITKTLFDSFAASNKNFTTSAIDNFNALNERVSRVAQQFNQFLAPAIDTVFGALQNGTSIPKALGQAFKALIAQLAITVVKAAVLAAILSVITAGGSAAAGAAGAAKAGGGFIKTFVDLLGFKQSAAPTFGNLQPGGLQLAGGVALTLRGTDLVGAISGANARINRVG